MLVTEAGGFDSLLANPAECRQALRSHLPTNIHNAVPAVKTEAGGFEPPKGFTPYLVSSEVLSATQPRLQIIFGRNHFIIIVHERKADRNKQITPIGLKLLLSLFD